MAASDSSFTAVLLELAKYSSYVVPNPDESDDIFKDKLRVCILRAVLTDPCGNDAGESMYDNIYEIDKERFLRIVRELRDEPMMAPLEIGCHSVRRTDSTGSKIMHGWSAKLRPELRPVNVGEDSV